MCNVSKEKGVTLEKTDNCILLWSECEKYPGRLVCESVKSIQGEFYANV